MGRCVPLAVCLLLNTALVAAAIEPRISEAPLRPPVVAPAPGPSVMLAVQYDASKLPPPVARLRDQLMDIAHSGDISRLKDIIDGNEGMPRFTFGDEADPIAFWKEISGDGEGREVLAILLEVLQSGYVVIRDDDDRPLYVWPYFAELPIKGLTPRQEVELYMLVTAQDRQDMEEFGAYNFFRVGIREDGQWQYFVAGD